MGTVEKVPGARPQPPVYRAPPTAVGGRLGRALYAYLQIGKLRHKVAKCRMRGLVPGPVSHLL